MELSPDQAGSAAVWFTTQAGVTALVLAVVCIALAAALVWSVRDCRQELAAQANKHKMELRDLAETFRDRIENFRTDVKEAFNQNDEIAKEVSKALHQVALEVAHMKGRRE